MTERKKREQKIHELAYFDELTDLAKRRLFQDRLEQALANAKRHNHQLAVLFLDLDLFKRINDTLGHQAADDALRQVTKRLQKVSRAGAATSLLSVTTLIHTGSACCCQHLRERAGRSVFSA